MGTVYEVEHTELGKRFVLKALLRELTRRDDLVLRLRNEWRALGRLEHPGIVVVTDAGTSATGVPYYVMERLEGETLAECLGYRHRLTVVEAIRIAVGLLDALEAAHGIGVVHRDIKPRNVFLISGNRPKLLDFGVAKVADDPGLVTARGIAVGTPRYMSPEQARGDRVDGRSDIYAVGLLLFEMIAGVNPFEDVRGTGEQLVAQIERGAPSLASIAMDVPEELDRVVTRMLAKDPSHRPASAREAAAALRRIGELLVERRSAPPGPDLSEKLAEADTVRAPGLLAREEDTTRPEGHVRASAAPRPSSSLEGLSWLEQPTLYSADPTVVVSDRRRVDDKTQPSSRALTEGLGAPGGDPTRTRADRASFQDTPPPVAPSGPPLGVARGAGRAHRAPRSALLLVAILIAGASLAVATCGFAGLWQSEPQASTPASEDRAQGASAAAASSPAIAPTATRAPEKSAASALATAQEPARAPHAAPAPPSGGLRAPPERPGAAPTPAPKAAPRSAAERPAARAEPGLPASGL